MADLKLLLGLQIDQSSLTEIQKELLKKSYDIKIDFDTNDAEQSLKDVETNTKGIFDVPNFFKPALSLFVSGIKDAFHELKSLDTILTQINNTSNLTAKQLQSISDNAFDAAGKYGQKASNYLTGVQEMNQAGYGNFEEMAELSMLTQSAGDMTAEMASQYLIATDAAYNLKGSVQDLNDILDGQNYITDQNTFSMSELAKATKISASQAAASGVEIDRFTAAVGTMIATTKQGGDAAGQAFKNILMNLSQMKGVTGTGDLIDDESLKKVEATCKNVGIELKEVKNGFVTLRDPMAILKDLSEAYRAMDDTDVRKSQIISDIGGSSGGPQLTALLEGWDTYKKMLSEFANGTGSAASDAMQSANSIEGSLNRLSNTWTETIGNIAESDAIVTGINALNGLLEVVNSVTDALGGLGTIGIGIGITSFLKNLDCQKVYKNCLDFYNWSNIDKELIRWFKVQVYAFGSSKINQRGVIAGTDTHEYSTKAESVMINVNVRNAEKTEYSAYGKLYANITYA